MKKRKHIAIVFLCAVLVAPLRGARCETVDGPGQGGWAHPSLLAILTRQDQHLGKALIYTVSRDQGGTIPDRIQITAAAPVFTRPQKLLLPPRTVSNGNFVYVYLPCEKYSKQEHDRGPKYLYDIERQRKEAPGGYTDVYKAQYRFTQGAEPLLLVIENSRAHCSVTAYALIGSGAGSSAVEVTREPVEFDKVFVCNASSC